MFKTIGILAHVDAGKTTLSEQILFRSGTIRSAGRVDAGSAFLDSDPQERRRGITIFSGQASSTSGDHTYYWIDTPGHADFSAEMERTLQALDYAVLVVSCVEGVQAHTEAIWKLLETYHIPTFFFLNKTDRDGASVTGTLDQIRRLLTQDVVLLNEGLQANAEEVASRDETLLDAYCANGFEDEPFRVAANVLIQARSLFPAFSGSALRGEGIDRFLAALDILTDTRYDPTAPLAARCYKVRHEKNGTRVCFLKILSGTLRVKENVDTQKIHEIRLYNGEKYTQSSLAAAGQICAVIGTDLRCGDTLGAAARRESIIEPLLLSSVLPDPSVPIQTVLSALQTLEQEEPQMHVHWLESSQRIQISTMGEIQLEVLREHVHTRFGLEICFGDCDILYKETIREPVTGCGHFEPLRHYAEVHVLLRPLPRGSGIRFSSVCSTDVLRTNWQRLIETHALEKQHIGALCGFPLTDVEIVLRMGRAHEKHTEGGDFRQATYRAVRNALFFADSVILEPYNRFNLRVPTEHIGRVLSDLQQLSASYDAPETDGAQTTVQGRCPVSELLGYQSIFSSFTKGRGVMRVRFDGYDICHNTQDVMDKHPYNREADTENTADSVFCAHGAGLNVKWSDAPRYMHCRPED